MNRPIYKKLREINADKMYPFHMPGHKRNAEFLKDFYEFIDLDFTEIDGTDNMHKPTEIILNSKKNTAKIFNSDESYFLVNGSSCGIIGGLISILKTGDNVLLARNCHISVYNGILLAGANPIYIYPSIKYGFACGINPYLIEKAINEYNVKACVITSPTYEGLTCNVEKIVNILHKKNIPLIVDEAHGAHFNLSKDFPKPALEQGADIVIQSFHKTLPALTQCAVLHLKSNLIDKSVLEKCISMVQTTSPSYIFMMSLEYCCNFIESYQQFIKIYLEKLKKIRKELVNLKNLEIINENIIGNAFVENFDISRLTFLIKKDVKGSFINNLLLKEGIQIEMYGENHIIAISTICDTDYGLNLFVKALKKIDSALDKFKDKPLIDEFSNNDIIKPKFNLKDVFYMEKEEIELSRAENRICADFITPYPPGIPILTVGEVITKDLINQINIFINNNIEILGINNNKILVLKGCL